MRSRKELHTAIVCLLNISISYNRYISNPLRDNNSSTQTRIDTNKTNPTTKRIKLITSSRSKGETITLRNSPKTNIQVETVNILIKKMIQLFLTDVILSNPIIPFQTRLSNIRIDSTSLIHCIIMAHKIVNPITLKVCLPLSLSILRNIPITITVKGSRMVNSQIRPIEIIMVI